MQLKTTVSQTYRKTMCLSRRRMRETSAAKYSETFMYPQAHMS